MNSIPTASVDDSNESLNAANELSLIDFFWETPVECFVFTSNDVHLWVAVTSPLDLPVYQTHVSPSPGDLPGHIPLFRLDNANRYFALDAHDGVLRVKSSLATHVDSKGTHCTNLNLLESNATKSDRPEWHLALFSRFREGQGGGGYPLPWRPGFVPIPSSAIGRDLFGHTAGF